MSSTRPSFTFSDLFAGIGGFHAALHAAGGRWVFASEIDRDASRVYDYNWLRPLREQAATPEEAARYRMSGDIVLLTDPKVTVPHADVLAAGFPCQPFSKSGFQRGMDETRGTLFWNIARILADETKRPSVVLLENVRNLAGPRHRDTTFKTIVRTLRELGYRTADDPGVFSPHLLPRELGGRPQVRERVFILAHYVGPEAAQDPANFDDPIVTPKSLRWEWRKEKWNLARDLPLEPSNEVDPKYSLESAELKWIETWDNLLTEVAERLGPGERLPGFPIWADDWRPLDEASDMIDVAAQSLTPFPAWKRSFLLKNAEFYERHKEVLDRYRMELDPFPASRRKFEWQAGEHRRLADTIMHFRPSGIRVKRPDYVPALVAITQTTVLGSTTSKGRPEERLRTARRITPTEAARLQGLPDRFEFKLSDEGDRSVRAQRDAASYKQMGNGVNVGAAYHVFTSYVRHHGSEIAEVAPDLVSAVESAGLSPDLKND
jgi:DNA (cytosine-5)-methyltransferase 1